MDIEQAYATAAFLRTVAPAAPSANGMTCHETRRSLLAAAEYLESGWTLTDAEVMWKTAHELGMRIPLDKCKERVRAQKASGLSMDEWTRRNLVEGLFGEE